MALDNPLVAVISSAQAQIELFSVSLLDWLLRQTQATVLVKFIDIPKSLSCHDAEYSRKEFLEATLSMTSDLT